MSRRIVPPPESTHRAATVPAVVDNRCEHAEAMGLRINSAMGEARGAPVAVLPPHSPSPPPPSVWPHVSHPPPPPIPEPSSW